jgi:hypothetical protein
MRNIIQKETSETVLKNDGKVGEGGLEKSLGMT